MRQPHGPGRLIVPKGGSQPDTQLAQVRLQTPLGDASGLQDAAIGQDGVNDVELRPPRALQPLRLAPDRVRLRCDGDPDPDGRIHASTSEPVNDDARPVSLHRSAALERRSRARWGLALRRRSGGARALGDPDLRSSDLSSTSKLGTPVLTTPGPPVELHWHTTYGQPTQSRTRSDLFG